MKPNIQIIQPSGILDGTQARQFRSQVNEAVDAGSKIILVDLKDVTFMDSSGLAALVLALKSVRSVDGKFCVCSVNDQVKMLFELTSMTRVFEIFESPEEFAKTFDA
ncbi:MAG: STAS domain-containing protein [Oscillatoriophycideae cyanobacterium NC_groundwater_1537_Pr4_S-0.65um_50_18]|nr:STAS domain-containing protein [Oscillatoriophycideae cyanobacterium NC_groundwater_1537_Pr4_S-0.65um_50_18]